MKNNKNISILAGVLLLFAILLTNLIIAQDNQEKVCGVYFTSLHCPNCAVVDPIVLDEWPKNNNNLVIIEYVFSSWTDTNAQVLAQYANNYESMSSVPNFFLDKDTKYLGRIDVPNAINKINNLDKNPCLLNNKIISFEDLNLNDLIGEPKVWANNRILIKKEDKNVESEFLKELLFTNNLNELISNSEYDINDIEPIPAPISDGEINFENAINIDNSWILQYNFLNSSTQGSSSNESLNESIINLPIVGKIDTSKSSILLITTLIGLADGFNPCAFFILTFLLAAMIYTSTGIQDKKQKRLRIATVGGIFIFFSGLVYFLFMSLWLNVFLFAKEIVLLTAVAGAIAIFAGIVNIKDYFYFQKGLSLTLPKKQKFKFQNKVEKLTKVKSFWLLILGTVVIAATVNMYELLCTVGFPMVYLGTLATKNLASNSYYLYILLYNICYIIPLAVIVTIFTITLGSKEFGKKNVQRLKLISGVMVLLLGLILIFKTSLLESILTPFIVIIIALILGFIIIYLKEFKKQKNSQTIQPNI